MPDQLEITDPEGGRRVVPVGQGPCIIGSAADADVCVRGSGIDAHHVRIVAAHGAMRVEPVRVGTTVEVNGEALFCKDLRSGDVFAVGAHRLRWLPDQVVAVAARKTVKPSPKSRGKAGRSTPMSRERPVRRSRGVPTSVSVLLVVAVVLTIGLLLLRHFRYSTWPSSPQNYVDLARTQLGNRDAQRALDTLAFALREATGATRDEALQLEIEIRRMLVELGEAPKIAVARQDHDLLLGFVDRYLRDSAQRPAAREFVRSCDRWLQQHGELCGRNVDGKPLLATVEQHRARFVAVAALDQPDVAADVLLAARSMLRFQWRDYRGALARLDAFLQQHPGDAEVLAERQSCLVDGEAWLRGKLRLLDQLIARGDRSGAERDLRQIERWSMLPEWEPLVREAQQRLGITR